MSTAKRLPAASLVLSRYLYLAIFTGLLYPVLMSAENTAILEGVCWNRDRSASFPDSTVPVSFDGDSGENVLWKTRLPNWSNSTPIIDNGKVFLMSEPTTGYFPWLLCVDCNSGKELWRREMNAFATVPESHRQQVVERVQQMWSMWQEQEDLHWEMRCLLRQQEKNHKNTPSVSIANRIQTVNEKIKNMGFEETYSGRTGSFRFKGNRQMRDKVRYFAKTGFIWDLAWRGHGTWVGMGFPSPVSYRRHVYVVTMNNYYCCYTHEGDLVWQRKFPTTDYQLLNDANRHRVKPKNGKWRPAWPGQGSFSTSPILAGGLMLTNTGSMLRALDPSTGEVAWEIPYDGNIGQCMAVPAVVQVGQEPVFIAVGKRQGSPERPAGDELIRIRDGQSVGFVPGCAASKSDGNGAIVLDGNLVVTMLQGQMVAYRLSWNETKDSIKATLVWKLAHPKGLKRKQNLSRLAWMNGLSYSRTAIIDLMTGKVVRVNPFKVGQGGYCGHGGFVARNAYCKWDLYKGEYHFFDRHTGKKLGLGKLPVNPKGAATPEQKRRASKVRTTWMWIGAGTPFVHKERLYIRSFDFLWCLGNK